MMFDSYGGWGGEHSNTSVVHMRDQRFSKHTPIVRFPLSGKTYPKQEFRAILPPNLPLQQAFLEDMLTGV